MKKADPVLPSDAGTWNVRTCGARGDGSQPETALLQEVVDACHRAGGGRVLLPPGCYVTGTLFLRSRVELHLTQGATLLGSPDIHDYPAEPFAHYYAGLPPRDFVYAHMLAALDADHVAVTGLGTIDGNGTAFFGPEKRGPPLHRFVVHDRRPFHTLAFFKCRDVLVEGIHMVNAPCYSLAPYGCERLRIEGITVRNDPSTPNGDGIDPDCCRDVVIHGCLIETGDDAIALKSWGLPPGEGRPVLPCENVVISDCVLRSNTVALRLGVEGDNPIRHVTMSNLVIQGRIGIGLYAVPHPMGNVLHGTPIDDVLCSQLTVEASTSPLIAMLQPGSAAPACIRNVMISQMRAVGSCAMVFYGSAGLPIERLNLRDIHLTLRGRGLEEPVIHGPVPPLTGFGTERVNIPHALYGRHLRGVNVSNLAVDWQQAEGPWDSAVRLDDSEKVALDGLDVTPAPQSKAGEAVQTRNIQFRRGSLCSGG